MPDEIDQVQENLQIENDAAIAAARRNATLAEGTAGVCVECDKPSPRLVRNHCARCRDELELP